MAKTDFLQFNAYRIKDLIKQKLAQDSNFTYQIYPGSNLEILIDIVAYMFQGMLYSLNTSAAESMFSDTQFYENINRLCNFLGYNPKGCSTPSATFAISNVVPPIVIPRYAYINTGNVDGQGRPVCYSFSTDGSDGTISQGDSFTLFNGKWKLYPNILTTTGVDWETFTLDLKSEYVSNNFIPHGFIDVYAYNNGKWSYFKPTLNQLFKPVHKINMDADSTNSNSGLEKFLYGGVLRIADNGNYIKKNEVRDNVFNLKLDENKNYQITFGDGTTGAKPEAGSLLYVVYLEGNGPSGTLDSGEVADAQLHFNSVGMTNEFWTSMIGIDASDQSSLEEIYLTNTSSSSEYRQEESVNEIRQNAPAWFRGGGRLVTKDDYESFFKYTPTIKGSVLDVKCQNNWEYISTFYKWLYELGLKKNPPNPRYYLNQNKLVKMKYQVADPADCNNVYIWYRPVNENLEEKEIPAFNKAAYSIKDMTHEPVACRGVPVNFAVSAAPVGILTDVLSSDGWHHSGTATGEDPSYIEVLMEDNVTYSNASVVSLIVDKIRLYFERDLGLGNNMNLNDLLASIYEINGIARLRTVYCPNENEPANAIVYNGLCFASWPGGNILDIGDDLIVSTTSRNLEIFQYPIYNGGTANSTRYTGLKNSIRIIKRSLTSLNAVQI